MKTLVFSLFLVLAATLPAQWTPPENADLDTILQEAREDTMDGAYDVALAKFVWFFENSRDTSMGGVRLSFALGDWMALADSYPPALEKLREIRDAAGKRTLESKHSMEPWTAFSEFSALNDELGESSKTLELFFEVEKKNPKLADRIYSVAKDELLRAELYEVCAKYVDPQRDYARAVEFFHMDERFPSGIDDEEFKKMNREHTEDTFSSDVGTLIALLVIDGRKAEASAVADKARQEWKDEEFYGILDRALEGTVPISKAEKLRQSLAGMPRTHKMPMFSGLKRPKMPSMPKMPPMPGEVEDPAVASAAEKLNEAPADWTPGDNPDPQTILDEARNDISRRRYPLALAKLSWYHENAETYDPGQSGVRVSFALGNWMDLANAYPPAMDKIVGYRDKARADVVSPSIVDPIDAFSDLAAINRELGEDEKTVDLFKELDAQPTAIAGRVFRLAKDALLAHREYALCAKYIDPEIELQFAIRFYTMDADLDEGAEMDAHLKAYAEQRLTEDVATLIALLVVNDRKAEAEAVAVEAKKVRDDTFFNAAIERALAGEFPKSR